MSNAEAFLKIFSGNPAAHYTFNKKTKEYCAVERGIQLADVERHLSGQEPGLLSIPIRPSGLTGFAAIDADRHADADVALNHAELARKVTELGLPLIVCRSKSVKSGHMYLFFKERDGFSAALARELMAYYAKKLEIGGATEIFPKQESLKEGQLGNGINLPFFGGERVAFGANGEELDVAGFIELVAMRSAYGVKLAERDLGEGTSGHSDTSAKDDPDAHTWRKETVQETHAKNLQALRDSNKTGGWNNTANKTAYFAGRGFAAKAIDGTKEEIMDAMVIAANPDDCNEGRDLEATLNSGWNKGILKPLKIVEDEFPEATKCLEEFNSQFYVVEHLGSKVRVCWETTDSETGSLNVVHQSFEDFGKRFMHQQIQVGNQKHQWQRRK